MAEQKKKCGECKSASSSKSQFLQRGWCGLPAVIFDFFLLRLQSQFLHARASTTLFFESLTIVYGASRGFYDGTWRQQHHGVTAFVAAEHRDVVQY